MKSKPTIKIGPMRITDPYAVVFLSHDEAPVSIEGETERGVALSSEKEALARIRVDPMSYFEMVVVTPDVASTDRLKRYLTFIARQEILFRRRHPQESQ